MKREPNEGNLRSFLRMVERLLGRELDKVELRACKHAVLACSPEHCLWACSALDEDVVVRFGDSMMMPNDRRPHRVAEHYAPAFAKFYTEQVSGAAN